MSALEPAVSAFLASYVRSLDDLQVLMLCADAPQRWWDAPAMAREAGIKISTARQVLDHLARLNLLDIRVTGDVRYCFSPGTGDLRTAAGACAAAYRARPLAVAQFVTGARHGALRDFADAFRIRRDDDR